RVIRPKGVYWRMQVRAMKLLTPIAVATFVLAGATASAEVSVTIHDRLVTIVAKDATARQILTHWARVGQARVVNAERVAGGPITMELPNGREGQALDLLLRTAAGYMAAPRPEFAANLSRFDRVIVMPTSSAPRNAATTPAPPPVFQQPIPQALEDEVDDDRPQPNAQVPQPNPRGPVFNTFPQPQVINPQTGAPVTTMLPGGFPQGHIPPQQQATPQPAQQQPTSFGTPTAPLGGGVAVPGMVVPAPQQQQPGQV